MYWWYFYLDKRNYLVHSYIDRFKCICNCRRDCRLMDNGFWNFSLYRTDLVLATRIYLRLELAIILNKHLNSRHTDKVTDRDILLHNYSQKI